MLETEYNYNVKYQLVKAFPDADPIWTATAYNMKGEYIGDLEWLQRLIKMGIVPEVMPIKKGPKHKDANMGDGCTCSIGRSVLDGKWYGWSHRAIYGFKVGDKVDKDSCCASSGLIDSYLKKHPELDVSLPVGFIAKTIKDTKRMAIAFADSVS